MARAYMGAPLTIQHEFASPWRGHTWFLSPGGRSGNRVRMLFWNVFHAVLATVELFSGPSKEPQLKGPHPSTTRVIDEISAALVKRWNWNRIIRPRSEERRV